VKWFRRKPRIDEEIYGRLLTSFGRIAEVDPFVSGPAEALAERVTGEFPAETARIDTAMYAGAARYHLKLLAGAWMEAREGRVPQQTAEVFHEALLWKFRPIERGSKAAVERLSALARGEVRVEEGPTPG
jgi:hypothetical protein